MTARPESDQVTRPTDIQIDQQTNRLERRFTFAGFIVGASNLVAYGAARAMAAGETSSHNPLFLRGPTGLGKTHLMQAIALEMRARRPETRSAYMSAETFKNAVDAALRQDDVIGLKQQLRGVDLLLLDDVQFLADKRSAELFNALNDMIATGGKVVIGADRAPSDFVDIEQRIRSRLSCGLIASIEPADYALRLAILRARAATIADVTCPDDVLEFLAQHIASNVRELEGALNRIAAYATLGDTEITIDTTRAVLADQIRAHARRITIDEIQRKTAAHYGLKLTDMHSTRRIRAIARPRQVAMYLSKKLTPRSLPEIGLRFGGRDHTTVIHAIRRVEQLRDVDVDVDHDVTILMREFRT